VDVVASGHTHQAYNCVIDGRLVTSAASYGRIVTKIDLLIDPDARRVVEKHARNIAITRDVPPDPEVLSTIAAYRQKAAPRMNRIVGYLKADFVSKPEVVGSVSCETPLGDLIADAELAATRDAHHGSADIAFMNPGGVRADLLAKQEGRPPHVVTYADAFEVQPFGNDLVTMSLTGAQIRAILQAQFQHDRPRVLQPSAGFGYSYRFDRLTRKATIDTWSVRLHGVPVDPDKTYRVTVSVFLAEGGDDFETFKQGTLRTNGGRDLEALTSYLERNSSAGAPLGPRPLGRVVGNACK
jgi:5'-nucleotidase